MLAPAAPCGHGVGLARARRVHETAHPSVVVAAPKAPRAPPLSVKPKVSAYYVGHETALDRADLHARSSAVVCPAVPIGVSVGTETTPALKPLPRAVENVADDPSLHNPLQRLERLGTGWMGVILEFEGVLVEHTWDVHTAAWQQLADEEGKPRPVHIALQRAEGMKNDQIIEEVLFWTRNPKEVRRLSQRKEDIYKQLLGDRKPVVLQGVRELLSLLDKNQVPVALTCPDPAVRLKPVLAQVGLASAFDAVVTAEDVYRARPDPEPYLYAAQLLGRPPVRCVVIGSSNQSVEAAHECGMACVAVAGRKPMYELAAADTVVRQLEELSFINLKQLFRQEELMQPQTELEEEQEFAYR